MATARSLSLRYGKPEVSCDSLVVMYLGKRSATLAEFLEIKKSRKEEGKRKVKLWSPAREMKFSRDHSGVRIHLDYFSWLTKFSGEYCLRFMSSMLTLY